jgi:hypothetical protein
VVALAWLADKLVEAVARRPAGRGRSTVVVAAGAVAAEEAAGGRCGEAGAVAGADAAGGCGVEVLVAAAQPAVRAQQAAADNQRIARR